MPVVGSKGYPVRISGGVGTSMNVAVMLLCDARFCTLSVLVDDEVGEFVKKLFVAILLDFGMKKCAIKLCIHLLPL